MVGLILFVTYRSFRSLSLNTHFKFAALSASLVLASACAVQYPIPSEQLQIENIVELPEELSETSGLFCETDGMYSLNDSGNAPVIYRINY